MAFASIEQAHGWEKNHMDWDPKHTIPPLICLCQDITNLIISEAVNVKIHSGEFILSLPMKQMKTCCQGINTLKGRIFVPYNFRPHGTLHTPSFRH